jgi:hypothetical protein
MIDKLKILKPIVISEFPKSGGSWIVSMLGDALQIPCRDIYMRSGFDLFDGKKHPWYQGADEFDFPMQCVIKSHEKPNSGAINFDATQVHLFRDGRDVVVSKYFFDKDFCVKNGITSSFEDDFDSFVEKTSHEWANYVHAWHEQSTVSSIRYERFLADPAGEVGALIFEMFAEELDKSYLDGVVSRFTRAKFSASLDAAFSHNTFVRKGVAGDWRNHFSEKNVAAFKSIAGNVLIELGYERDQKWHSKNVL